MTGKLTQEYDNGSVECVEGIGKTGQKHHWVENGKELQIVLVHSLKAGMSETQ